MRQRNSASDRGRAGRLAGRERARRTFAAGPRRATEFCARKGTCVWSCSVLQARGKGTQGVVLGEHFGVPHVSSGALPRREVAAATTLGRRVERYVASGEFVPDDLVLAIVVGALDAGARAEGYILDGFPRTLTQVRSACAVAPSDGIAVDVVVYLAMPDDVARRRVGRPRRAGPSRRHRRGGDRTSLVGVSL